MQILHSKQSHAVFPISAKKCEKCEIFSGILHWNFANSGVFPPAKNRCFCFPPKTIDSCGSRRLALVCRTNRGKNLQNSDEGHFFFGDQHKIREKDASVGAMTFFFFFEITLKLDKKDEKIFGIFTLSLGRLHYFRHFCRRWKLRGNTGLMLDIPKTQWSCIVTLNNTVVD